jgi:retron-type reverse transcriptase
LIVYRELPSLVSDLAFSARTLYSVSNNISAHYRKTRIPKKGGGFRELAVPDRLLKVIQQRINERLLPLEPVSPYATAYRPGGSTRRNASPHVGKPVVLKLDVFKFFDHAIYPLVKEKVFPAERYSERNRVLLALLCTYRDALPQGAPTSPAISNILLREFDLAVGAWCGQRGIAFTRYCDDMTFSGDFDPEAVIPTVKSELRKLGFFLNDRKTTVVRAGRCQLVTGLVVNERLGLPAEYLRDLRQELYYCRKYGLRSHMVWRGLEGTPEQYAAKLLGRVAYALSVEPENRELADARVWLLEERKR